GRRAVREERALVGRRVVSAANVNFREQRLSRRFATIDRMSGTPGYLRFASSAIRLMYVTFRSKLTYMEKTQVYLRKEELEALRVAAARAGRSVADLSREAIRKTVLRPEAAGPVALWDGEPRRTAVDHDSIYDET